MVFAGLHKNSYPAQKILSGLPSIWTTILDKTPRSKAEALERLHQDPTINVSEYILVEYEVTPARTPLGANVLRSTGVWESLKKMG